MKGKLSFCAFFILSAHSENTWKVFKRLWGMHGKYLSASNGKSLIVEERIYSFFFAFFPKKTKLRFFVFPLLHNEERRRSFCFDLVKFLKGSLRSASFSQNFGTILFVLPSILKKLG